MANDKGKPMLHKLHKYPELRKKLFNWWLLLQDKVDEKTPSKSGVRAELSRATFLEEVALNSEFFIVKEFFDDAIRESEYKKFSLETVAVITALFAIIRTNDEQNGFIQKLAKTKDGKVVRTAKDNAVFSELRFKKLLSSYNWEEFYTNIRRSIQILDKTVNPIAVADTVLLWSYDFDRIQKGEYIEPGKSAKFKIAQMYYEKPKTKKKN